MTIIDKKVLTLGEYKAEHPGMGCCYREYGEDIPGGFGRKGWTAYGDCDNMRVMDVITTADGTPKIILGNPIK